MTDFVDMFTSGIPNNIDQKKKKENIILSSPVLYKTGDNIMYTFLLDKPLYKNTIEAFKKKIRSLHIYENYQILYALKLELTEKDEKKTIWKQYRDFKWDYTKFIPPNSKIICFGEALFSICESNDLDGRLVSDEENDNKKKDSRSIIEGFYDTILGETSFYDPKTKCQIFPVDKLSALFNDTDLFLNNFEHHFFKVQVSKAKNFTIRSKKIKKIEAIKVNPNEFLRQHLHEKELIGLDLETKGVDPFSNQGKIVCVTIAYSYYIGYYLPWEDIDVTLLREYLKDRPVIGSNIKYDIKWLSIKAGMPVEEFNIVGDTMLLQHNVNELQRRGLKGAVYLYTNYGGYDAPLSKYLEEHPEVENDYSLIPEEILIPYASTDPCASLQVHDKLLEIQERLDQKVNASNPYGYSLKWLYSELKIPVLKVFIGVELEGMNIDKKILKKQSEEIKQRIEDLEKEILEDLNETKATFKLASNDHLGKKLKSLGWPITDYNKKGLPTVGEEQLKQWEKRGYTLATKILRFRKENKLLSTYVGQEEERSGMYRWIKDDEKIHSTYDVFGTFSGRHKSKEPNGQNWVSHGDAATLVRSFITPPKNTIFISGDYSGLQLRLATIVSKDKKMRESFSNKNPEERDLHITTAFNVMLQHIMNIGTLEEAKEILKNKTHPNSKVVKDYRFKAKSINFGLLFGSSAVTLVNEAIRGIWDDESLTKYISANKLEEKMVENLVKIESDSLSFFKASTPLENKLNAMMFTVATDVRTKFFEAYSGLADWIERSRIIAKKQGYIVSVYGGLRRLPYLTFGPDKGDVDKAKYHNLLNICLNSPIQNMEAVVVNRSMLEIYREVQKQGLKSRFFGQIHDAIEAYGEKEDDDWKKFVKIFFEKCTYMYPEYDGIPLDVEVNVADFEGKNELWDMGRGISFSDIDSFEL